MGDERGAIRCYQKSLAIQMRAHGRDHPVVAATLSNLGCAHGRLGEHQWAVDCHERALTIQEARAGPEDVGVATSLHNLGLPLPWLGAVVILQGVSGGPSISGVRPLGLPNAMLQPPCIALVMFTVAWATLLLRPS